MRWVVALNVVVWPGRLTTAQVHPDIASGIGRNLGITDYSRDLSTIHFLGSNNLFAKKKEIVQAVQGVSVPRSNGAPLNEYMQQPNL